MYCGDCTATMRVANFPTCRAPVGVSDEVRVERLRRLLARSPGRHTPVAQCHLGWMYEYENGAGVPRDSTEAAEWYRHAADQGDAAAQCNLGLMYKNGTGVPQDFTDAAR